MPQKGQGGGRLLVHFVRLLQERDSGASLPKGTGGSAERCRRQGRKDRLNEPNRTETKRNEPNSSETKARSEHYINQSIHPSTVDGWAHTVRYYKTGPLLEQLENAAWYGIVKQNVLVVGCGVVWCGV
mmetsp:Transcript_2518/g.5110  ORF Transcript_2518/g.5110 Transcript_2518/m.5110 type:complete len:128 (+) Transcript_2518:885-1268(+)